MKTKIALIRKVFLSIAFLSIILNSKAQVIQEVQNSFNLYKQTALQEKVFVHTDKDTYLPGEIIWFKIYCVDGNDHKPLNLSKVAYIDLLDNYQNPVVQAKVELTNGSGSGSIYVPVSVSNGYCHFRCYTSWMKNFGPEFYFEKRITIVNPLKSPEPQVKIIAQSYDVQLFPEGGDLVSDLTSKVAFKAVDQNGKGVDITGVIVNQHNDTAARFRSLKFGMGNFDFTPAADNTYKAIIRIRNNKPFTKDLPEIRKQGMVMKLTDNGPKSLTVNINSTSIADGNIYLFVHTRQSINVAESVVMANGSASFTIDKSKLGDGISHITIFNGNRQPFCERLYCKLPSQQLFIEAGADQQQYGLRKKVNINVSAKNKTGQSLAADMSMAVYRVDSLQDFDHTDIFNYLWLTSELRGNVESANYYFKDAGPETSQALDNLMLTQGWSRFKWNDLLENTTPRFKFLPEYYGHIITAKIVNTVTNAPAKGIITYLGIPGKRVQLYPAKSDSSGNLLYNTKNFYGANEIIVQTNTMIDSTYRVEVATPFSDRYDKNQLPHYDFKTGILPDLQLHSLGVQVLNLYSADYLRRFDVPLVDSSAFYGKPDASYKLDDYTRFTTMEEDLREYVKEDNIIKSRGNFHIKVLTHNGFLSGTDPLVLVDGVPLFSINKLMTIDPLKVRKLEVMATPYYYGPVEEQGIFSFTTYKGDLGGIDLDPHAVVLDYEGLQLQREFYSPVYDTPVQSASRIPDFRNLLYWSPSVATKGTVSFYTSDLAGKYVGVVQGITAKGDAGSQYFMFEVK